MYITFTLPFNNMSLYIITKEPNFFLLDNLPSQFYHKELEYQSKMAYSNLDHYYYYFQFEIFTSPNSPHDSILGRPSRKVKRSDSPAA